MKIVKRVVKANRLQIAALSSRETANVIAVAQSTKAPVSLTKASMWPMGMRKVDRSRVIATIVNGSETVESFKARGGTIKVATPCLRGMNVYTVRTGHPTRNTANRMMPVRKVGA